jgi:hypothetical protein
MHNGSFDTTAKSEVQGLMHLNATGEDGGGCTVCKHPGARVDKVTCYPYEADPSPMKTQKEIITLGQTLTAILMSQILAH